MKTWVPHINYKYPCGKRNMKFQHQWLSEFQWLAYSDLSVVTLCKVCVIFAADLHAGKGVHDQLILFVKKSIYKMENKKSEIMKREAIT